ncbi:MAG: COG4705 family protein [Rhodanobacteraceae bacterium]
MQIPIVENDTTSSKVAEVTLTFWIMKILATTLGETGGDALSMSLNFGYLLSTFVFGIVFAAAVTAQIRARRFHPTLYWLTIIATTTVGTTLADFADRSLGIGYLGGSTLLLAALLLLLTIWHRSLGSIAVDTVTSPKAEGFYWITIMFSQTLGTALGDWSADSAGLGYIGAMLVFGGLIVALAALYRWTRVSHVALFWAAFVLTRPLGAVVGDFLDKPFDAGGLALSRFTASAVLLALIALSLIFFPQRAARRTEFAIQSTS